MKNTVIRCLYFLVALVCVLVSLTSCKKAVDIDNSSSEPVKVVEPVVSEPEDTSSVEETVSEPEVSEPTETASEVQQTQSTTTTNKKQTSSKTIKTQTNNSGGGVTINPVNPPTVWNGDRYTTDPNWKCPDPSAHPHFSGELSTCNNQKAHASLIESSKKIDEENAVAAQQLAQKAAAHGMTVDEYNNYMRNRCPYCERPYGDGHNGTCNGYYDNNGYPHCVNYD